MIKCSLLLVNFAFFIGISGVEVDYLKSAQRFQTNFRDYYFSCNILGQTLQWEVNQIRLGGFEMGSAKAWTSSKNGLNYTAALLSSNSTSNGQISFDSVLLISMPNDSRLDVICRSESEQNSTSNEVEPLVHNPPNGSKISSQNIHLEYILTKRIISRLEDLSTSIFICGVANVYQTWQAKGPRYGFDTTSTIGQDRVQSQDAAIVDELAILIARQPYQIVTVLFVTDAPNVTVVCASGEEEVRAPAVPSSIITTPMTTSFDDNDRKDLIVSTFFPELTTDTVTVKSSVNNQSTDILTVTSSVNNQSNSIIIVTTILASLFVTTVLIVTIISILIVYRKIAVKEYSYEMNKALKESPIYNDMDETLKKNPVYNDMDETLKDNHN